MRKRFGYELIFCIGSILFLLFVPTNYFAQETKSKEENKYVSPMKENGIPADFNRHMFVEPALSRRSAMDSQFWINDIIRFGAYLRPRQEIRYNLDFNASDKAYIDRIMQTTSLFFIIDPSPYIQAKVTLQDARVWGGSSPASNGDIRAVFFNNTPEITRAGQTNSVSLNQTGIREAFILLNKLPLNSQIQMGRQVWAYGDQRMIGGANWTINGLSFDGARIMFNDKAYRIHFLYARPYWTQSGPNGVVSANDPRQNSNASGTDTTLGGTYNSFTIQDTATIDIYALGILRKWRPNTVNPVTGLPNESVDDPLAQNRAKQNQNLLTAGFRITNRTENNFLPKTKRWDVTFESAFQHGTSGRRINDPYISTIVPKEFQSIKTERAEYVGRFYVFQTGYKLLDNLRLGGQVQYSSGDKNRNDGSISTFQTLANPRFGNLPNFNQVAGLSENINAQNLYSKSIDITYFTENYGTFQISYFQNDKAERQDAWYAISGDPNSTANIGRTNSSPVSLAKGSTENFADNPYQVPYSLGRRIYTEIDFNWMWLVNSHVSLWFGVGHLYAGDSIRNYRNSLLQFDSSSNQFVWNQNAILGRGKLARDANIAYFQINASF